MAVPGADDAAIQADILKTMGRDTRPSAPRSIISRVFAGKSLASLDQIRRDAVASEFRRNGRRCGRGRSSASCCNAITATTACCARSGWSFARHSR